MIYVRLSGGLGNQIFILGAALVLSKKSNINKIIIDSSGLESYNVKRKNELNSFFNLKEYNISFDSKYFLKFRFPKIFSPKINYFPLLSDNNYTHLIERPNNIFNILDGYFQKNITQDVFDLELSLLKDALTLRQFNNNEGCVIHIRGGDFLNLGWDSVASREYYQSSINFFINNYGVKNFYLITEDISYAKKLLIDIDYEDISKGDLLSDFDLISSFKYRILSASTFSFWASALSSRLDQVVIAPKYWTPGVTRQILLPGEVKL